MTRFLIEEDPKKNLEKLLGEKSFNYNSIQELDKFPKYFSYSNWSFGPFAENDYYYKITYIEDGTAQEILTMITVLFGVFILRIEFFKDSGKKITTISL